MNQGANRGSGNPKPATGRDANVSQATGSRGTSEETDAGLVELLRELHQKQGPTRAAKRLGVDRKTLAKGLEREYLTPRLKSALETERQAVERAEADALEARLAGLEAALQDLGGELRREWREEWRGEWRAELRALREELASVRVGLDTLRAEVLGPDPAATPDESLPHLDESDEGYAPRRIYPQLVAVEPAPDDEEVYGRAWPLVREWRERREVFEAGWPQLAGREAEARILELELRLVEEHRLTLPPDRVPWDEFARRDELQRRRNKLALARRNLRRARLRRRLLRVGGIARFVRIVSIVTLGRRGLKKAGALVDSNRYRGLIDAGVGRKRCRPRCRADTDEGPDERNPR